MRDFTLDAYMALIGAAQQRGLPIWGVARWLQDKPTKGVLVRHDVDRCPQNALRMAEAEAQAGVLSTYYFRVVGSAFNPAIIRAIYELGHEVGYHYEDLALAKGNMTAALALFQRHLERLREIAPIQTIAMHGSPLSKHNNLDLWRHADMRDYELLGEAFMTVDYKGLYYFTDTGRSWGATSTNLRDRPKHALAPREPIRTSQELAAFISAPGIEGIAMSAHPERWDTSSIRWVAQAAKDTGINLLKKILSNVRR